MFIVINSAKNPKIEFNSQSQIWILYKIHPFIFYVDNKILSLIIYMNKNKFKKVDIYTVCAHILNTRRYFIL